MNELSKGPLLPNWPSSIRVYVPWFPSSIRAPGPLSCSPPPLFFSSPLRAFLPAATCGVAQRCLHHQQPPATVDQNFGAQLSLNSFACARLARHEISHTNTISVFPLISQCPQGCTHAHAHAHDTTRTAPHTERHDTRSGEEHKEHLRVTPHRCGAQKQDNATAPGG